MRGLVLVGAAWLAAACSPSARDRAIQACIERFGGGQPPSRVAECWSSDGAAGALPPPGAGRHR